MDEGGLKSLYRGWEAYALRQFVWNGTFFALIGAAKAVTLALFCEALALFRAIVIYETT